MKICQAFREQQVSKVLRFPAPAAHVASQKQDEDGFAGAVTMKGSALSHLTPAKVSPPQGDASIAERHPRQSESPR